MKQHFLTIALLISLTLTTSAQTIGLQTNTPQSFDGYTLFAPIKSTTTYLINNCGELVHSWTSQYAPNLSCYLLEDGTLLRTSKNPGMGGGGRVEMIDWESTVLWDYSNGTDIQHHDIELLPNGNLLLILNDTRTQMEVFQAGSSTQLTELKSEQIIEVQPDLVNGGGTIVWQWKAWDHLIQDTDSTKANYGTIADHPEKIDINFLNHTKDDWLHINGIAYHSGFDQIMVSVHNHSEFWIIDHSTTTQEAASSTGGTYGKGGDLLYRWGNPQAYGQGTPNDQKLFLQHHTHWIPDTLSGGGKIILFNNQAGNPMAQDYSTVNVVELPVDGNGFYTYTGGAYAPTDFDWTYQAPNPTDFFSSVISGVQRLPNGNTLICEGTPGRFFEVDANGTLVWEYINPVNDQGPQTQGTTITDNNTFRCTRYAPDYPAFTGRDLTPQGYIETGSTFDCDLYAASISETSSPQTPFQLYPIPAQDYMILQGLEHGVGTIQVHLYDLNGQEIKQIQVSPTMQAVTVDVREVPDGMYLIKVSSNAITWHHKVVIAKP